MTTNAAARDIEPGDEILTPTLAPTEYVRGTVGAVNKVTMPGVVYVWLEPIGTMGKADAILNHGDPVTILNLDTASSASRQHYIDTGRYLRTGEAYTATEATS